MSFKKYFKCKTIESLVEEASNSKGFERTLGAFQLILLGIGAIIGAGIFVFTGPAAGQHAGPAIVISFALAGFACACAALCYAELASMIPVAGSSYTYAYAALGELPAWLIAGMITLTYVFGSASVAGGWSEYLKSFLLDYGIVIPAMFSAATGTVITHLDGSTTTALLNLPAFAIVIALTSILYFGSESSATFNAIIVVIKMSVLLAFIVVGSFKVNVANWQPFIPENTGKFGEFGLSGIVAGAGVVFLAYSGFDAVATAAQETKNPKRDLPIGIIGSLVICIVFYILVSAVLTGLASYKELNVAGPMAVAVNKMNMPWFATLIKIGAICGLTSVILVLTYGAIRIFYTITNDGLLPKGLAKMHNKYRTPHILTMVVGLTIATITGIFPTDKLAKLANFGTLVTFAIVCVGTVYLRYKKPELKREFECPFVPVIPVIGILLFGCILFGLPNEIFLYAGVWIAVLLIIYFGYSRHHSLLLQMDKDTTK